MRRWSTGSIGSRRFGVFVLSVVFAASAIPVTAHGQDGVPPAIAQGETAGATVVSETQESTAAEHWQPPIGNTDFLSINAFAFEAWSDVENAALSADGGRRYLAGTPDIGFLEAPVELPDGSTILGFELEAFDIDAAFAVELWIFRCPLGTLGCSTLGYVTTNGTPGPTLVGGSLPTPHVVDNTANTYIVQVGLGNNAATALSAVRVAYEPPVDWPLVATMSMNAFAFEPFNVSGRDRIRADAVRRYCESGVCYIVAPVELPSGTSVGRIELDAYDNGGGSVRADLGRCPVGFGGCDSIGGVETTGTPGTVQVGADLSVPEIIENSINSYFVQVELDATMDYAVTGVRLLIAPPAPEFGVDRLTMNAFAFEPYNLVDRALLDASGPMRFCSGASCLAIGPVELPSGAWVRSLDIEAYDNAAANVTVDLVRCPVLSSLCSLVETFSTSGTPGMTVDGVRLARPEYVDNLNFSYAIQIQLGPSFDTGFFSVSMEVDTQTVFDDGFELGDLTRWSDIDP